MQLEYIDSTESEKEVIVEITCQLNKEQDTELLVRLFNMAFTECCIAMVVDIGMFKDISLDILTTYQVTVKREI